jgi:hypothetical protein
MDRRAPVPIVHANPPDGLAGWRPAPSDHDTIGRRLSAAHREGILTTKLARILCTDRDRGQPGRARRLRLADRGLAATTIAIATAVGTAKPPATPTPPTRTEVAQQDVVVEAFGFTYYPGDTKYVQYGVVLLNPN